MIHAARFIREDARFSEKSKELFASLQKGLESKSVDPTEYLASLLRVTLQPHLEHNSVNESEFYNELLLAILDAIQVPSEKNVQLSSALSYLDKIDFAGFAPRFSTNPVLNQVALEDVEPVFNVWCQDDLLVPESTLSFRVTIGKNGEIHFNSFNVAWLAMAAPTIEAPPPPPNVRKPKGKKGNASKKAAV